MKKHDFWKLLKMELSVFANELFLWICVSVKSKSKEKLIINKSWLHNSKNRWRYAQRMQRAKKTEEHRPSLLANERLLVGM